MVVAISFFCLLILNRLKPYIVQLDVFRNLTSDNFNGAYLAISQIVDYFNFINFPNVNILKSKRELQMTPFCMFFRKHSCLLQTFDDQILRLTSSGLMQSWSRQYQIPQFHRENQMEPAKTLKFNQISGVITVCIWLTVASIVVFVLEILSKSHAWIKTILDFLTFSS